MKYFPLCNHTDIEFVTNFTLTQVLDKKLQTKLINTAFFAYPPFPLIDPKLLPKQAQ